MDGQLSKDVLHKLDAAVTSAHRNADQHLPPHYVKACRAWYATLSESDRVNAAEAVSAVLSGSEARARRFAAALPAAPPSS